MATESPKCSIPVKVPGGNPVIESAGQTPISPVTIVGPMLLTTGVAPRIPKLQLAPKAIAPAGGGHAAVVMKVHTLFAGRWLPNVSTTPVVIVAVKEVFGARLANGVNVATFVTGL